LVAELGHAPERAGLRTRSELVLRVVSALVVLASAASFVGAVTIWRTDLLPPVKFAAAVGLVVVGLWWRPRFGRLEIGEAHRLGADEAPHLRALVRQVAEAAGTPEPDVILLDPHELNLWVTRVGLRGRSVLSVGIPLWLMLTPQMRVAVLAHELGHLTNADPARSIFTQPAHHLFRRAVEWTGGSGADRRRAVDVDEVAQRSLIGLAMAVVLATINALLTLAQLMVDAAAMPDHRRAEYAADLVSRKVAGTQAARAAIERLAALDELLVVIDYEVTRTPPGKWEAILHVHERRLADDLPALRQSTRRTTDVWSTHPPQGMRLRLIESLPEVGPVVTLDSGSVLKIDHELSAFYALTHRQWLDTREFHG